MRGARRRCATRTTGAGAAATNSPRLPARAAPAQEISGGHQWLMSLVMHVNVNSDQHITTMGPTMESNNTPAAVLVVAGTSSGVGKTITTVGLMAAFASRGHTVQPFKCGPDFLDGRQHEAAIRAGEMEYRARRRGSRECGDRQDDQNEVQHPTRKVRKCVNLDAWMMGSKSAMCASFHRHAAGADVCIIEGCMGLHDSKDGVSDEGSTAQTAKLLTAPVVLVIDGSQMARSVAAMALGYALFDAEVRLGAVVANKVGGPVHKQWIGEALEQEGRLKDGWTEHPVLFAGALPTDTAAVIPERHLGLTLPAAGDSNMDSTSEQFVKLACLVETHLDLDALLHLGRTTPSHSPCRSLPATTSIPAEVEMPAPKCRIGIADDEAFCFYYLDNLHLLQLAGAELVPFSPLRTARLPPRLDGIYMGGGYPELHAADLEANASLRQDILGFSEAGGAIFAECGGFMYLATALFASKEDPPREMCGVFPVSVRMTPRANMYYAEIAFPQSSPSKSASGRDSRFPPAGGTCRGQRFHYSEVVESDEDGASNANETSCASAPLLVTPLLPGAEAEEEGYSVRNTVASYFHLHFLSFRPKESRDGNTLAEHFVESAMRTSPHRKARAVSFVSAATEIVFALGAEASLAGVTSVCDYPQQAQCAPREIVCRAPIDATTMSSEEMEKAMQELKLQREKSRGGPPGHWLLDVEALRALRPAVAFVQNTCDICDPSMDDVLNALASIKEEETEDVQIVRIAPTTLEGLFRAVDAIATVLDVPTKGEELARSMRERLQAIEEKVSKLDTPRPRVLSLEGLAPLCVGGNWLPDMKYAAGCVDALDDRGGCPARVIGWEEVLKADPDILVISPCSASPARTLNELHLLASASEFWKLRCVQIGEVYIIDHGCFSRPGPRLVEGIEMMAAIFRNIHPPHSEPYSRWTKDVLRYQCQTQSEDCTTGKSTSHCTTELSVRFKPLEMNNSDDDETCKRSCEVLLDRRSQADRCRVTRCTIQNSPLPPDRSAHCIVTIHRKGKQLSLLLFGGENQDAKRLGDCWELHAPSDGWDALCRLDENSIPELGATPTWEKLICGKVVGEDVPTHRSNHAMILCGGEHILVFGGWSIDNMTPLSHCELLHSESLCWTHCSTRGLLEPSPRGNPTLVYRKEINSAILFGGWNGIHALNDLWVLNMNSWEWQDMTAERSDHELWPNPRTDHTSVLWENTEDDNVMLVFGGNVEMHGPCSELWALSFSDDLKPTWRLMTFLGPHPPARTSHAAAIVGAGNQAKMVVLGGTSSELGTGPGAMLCDAWILHLNNGEKCVWTRLDWSAHGLARCRHSMAVVNDDTIIWWGGFDGDAAVMDEIGIWRGDLMNVVTGSSSNASEEKALRESKKEEKKAHALQDRWQADIPTREDDLPLEMLEKARRSKLPGALYKAIHRHAVAQHRDTYIDPASGYSVFTTLHLKRRPCCGNGCRHCPHGHTNVPGKKQLCDDKHLDW